jgi:hypothetical protein
VIGLAGLKELLNEQPAHKSRVKAEPDYSRKNNLLHAILLHCTSEGIALHLVKKYEDDADGYLAYKHLYNHYQGHGNQQQYYNTLLTKIMSLSLTHTTHGGMDTYLGKFEELAQELALHGDPLSEAQKITMLLNGIKDRKYSHLKTLCRTENYSYNKVLLEFRRESQELDSTEQPKRNLKNKTTRRPPNKQPEKKDSAKDLSKVPNDYRLPPNVWKLLTRKQQAVYKKALRGKGHSSADFIEDPNVIDASVPRRMHSKKTSAFDSVDQLQKP